MNRHIHFALLAAALLAAAPAFAADATYSDCVRDAGLDLWASYDNAFSQKIMAEVFKGAGIDARRLPFAPDGSFDSGAEVICSAFRTPELLEKYDFPLQPLGRMHYALYTTADRAMTMMSTRVTDWPRLRVGYSPVSQGQNQDREDYFKRANLAPAYVEFPTSAEAVESLRTNALDALFLYTPLGRRPEGLVEIVPMGERNVYFAVRKSRPELLKALSAAYRDFYIDHIGEIDAWRTELLGIPPPAKRVRLAAYSRGDFFSVSPDGVRSGSFENWMRTLCGHTHCTEFADWYGDGGHITQMTFNSVWKGKAQSVYEPGATKPEEYGNIAKEGLKKSGKNPQKAEDHFKLIRPGLKGYTIARAAGSYKMNVTPDGVTVDFYAGDDARRSTRFILR